MTAGAAHPGRPGDGGPASTAVTPPPPASRVRVAARVGGGLALLALLLLLARKAGGYVPAFAAWVDGLGALGPLVFVLGYAVATVALVPGSLLTLASGAVFGLAQGTLWAFLGASLGAIAAFVVGRYLARGAVERRIARSERFAQLDRAIARQGRRIVFLLRLSPVFPFVFINYALGL
ncbi:MAG TPA: VTT domain-containing protein, partial [Thermoanaerobaculia bacterium]|nr:VTT domain-containing protein [Thermoanaerobaculia bacterium]